MKKSTIFIILLAVLFLAAAGAAALIYKMGQDKQEELNQAIQKQNEIITQLQADIAELNQTQTVYRLARGVKSGEVLTSDDIETIQVGIKLTAGYDTTLEDLVGMTMIADGNKGQMITKEFVYPVELRHDYRTLDVICDRQPIGFSKGDTVDVRISFPNGQDFLLLSKKLVNDVYGNCVQIVVDEKDILIYKSAEADWSRFYKTGQAGTAVQIYCTTYVAAGAQDATKQYYPIQTKLPDGETFEGSTLWIALNDYNLKEADLEEWLAVNREQFEAALRSYDYYWNELITYKVLYSYEALNEHNQIIRVTEEAEISCLDDEEKRNIELAKAFGNRVLTQSDRNWVILTEISREPALDLEGGSKAVNNAKLQRDNMYVGASNSYATRRAAMIQAKAEAKLAYEKKLEEGTAWEPWNDNMFDAEQWEQDYTSGVLEYIKNKQAEEDAAAQAEKDSEVVAGVVY